jgi:hypothetical protein
MREGMSDRRFGVLGRDRGNREADMGTYQYVCCDTSDYCRERCSPFAKDELLGLDRKHRKLSITEPAHIP